LSKVNVDAALSKNSDKAAIAAVVRDEGGKFMGASVVVLEGVTDPEMLEALACRKGFAVAADLLLPRFRVASDCSNAVRSIQREGKGPYGHVVQEIKARSREFGEVHFVHEGRTYNIDAHTLARSSIYLDLGRHVWLGDSPDGVCNQYVVI
jgi:ribonuclease HI